MSWQGFDPSCLTAGCEGSSSSTWVRCPRWMTPRPAVAPNLAQLVARDSQSRLLRRKVSAVVPECMMALAKTSAEWHTLLRASTAALAFFSSTRSAWLWECRNSRYSRMGVRPEMMLRSRFSRCTYCTSSSGTPCARTGMCVHVWAYVRLHGP